MKLDTLALAGLTVTVLASLAMSVFAARRTTKPILVATLTGGPLFIAAAVAMDLPPVYTALNLAAGWNVVWPVQRAITLVDIWLIQTFFVYIDVDATDSAGTKRATRRVAISFAAMVLSVAAMCALFAINHNSIDYVYGPQGRLQSPGPVELVSVGATTIANPYMAYCSLSTAVMCWRWSRRTNKFWLRVGLVIWAVSRVLAALFVIHICFWWLSAAVGHVPSYPELAVDVPISVIAILLSVIGVMIPTWAATPAAIIAGIQYYRARVQLYPLRMALQNLRPEIANDVPATARRDRLRITRLKSALVARTLALWDVYAESSRTLPAELRAQLPTRIHADTTEENVTAIAAAVSDDLRTAFAIAGLRPDIAPLRVHRAVPAKDPGLRVEVQTWQQVNDLLSAAATTDASLAEKSSA